MELTDLIKERHSVRSYKDLQIEDEKKEVINNLITEINNESSLHIQVFYDDKKCFDSFLSHYGKFTNVSNYISLVGIKGKDLDEKLGYYAAKIILKLQELGLNSCIVGLTHGKSKAIISKGEKENCLISFGYGINSGVSHNVKKVKEVSNYKDGDPKWFHDAIEMTLLAPTAMNQQKYYFELKDDNKVNATAKMGFYTKFDLGIVKYYFQLFADPSFSFVK